MRNLELQRRLGLLGATAALFAVATLGGLFDREGDNQAEIAAFGGTPQPIFIPYETGTPSPQERSSAPQAIPDQYYPGCGAFPEPEHPDPYADDQGLGTSIVYEDGKPHICERPFDAYVYLVRELEKLVPEETRRAVTIIIMDSGVIAEHEDWCGELDVNGISVSFVDQYGDVGGPHADIVGHGTLVASIANACADNGIGIGSYGMGAVDLASFRVAHAVSGGAIINPSGFIAALVRVGEVAIADPERMFVVNMSFAGFQGWDGLTKLLDGLPDNVALIAGAGNADYGGPVEGITYPAAHPRVIAVGAANQESNNELCQFSHFVLDDQSFLVATGCFDQWGFSTNTESPFPYVDGRSGTSFSSPQLAGLVANLLRLFPGLPKEQILQVIKDTALDVTQDTQGNPVGPLPHIFPLGALQELLRQAGYPELAYPPTPTPTATPLPPELSRLFLPLMVSGQ
jgi:subtilisin family serine protease